MGRDGGHWSRKGAMCTLRALVHLGGSGTTLAIEQLTDSRAVHSDIDSLRRLVMAEMHVERDAARRIVTTTRHGQNANGRQVIVYAITPAVADVLMHLPPPPAGPSPPAPPPADRVAPDAPLARQTTLFETASPTEGRP